MKKQTKIVAVASAAAMLAIGASMTSFAATGWVEEDGQWYYYDKDGNRVEDEWKKSGDNWYWLDSEENGAMATDKLVDDDNDTYYVDGNGVMVKNTWVKVVNEDQDDDDDPAEYRYYYMQNSGKAYKASDNGETKFKTIDGKKYAFDEDGKMLYGWLNTDSTMATDDSDWENALYYCGSWEDGALKTGWQKISVYDQDEDDDYDYWFNFKSNGKKRFNEENSAGKLEDTVYEKKINGKTYGFDTRGVMVYQWAVATKTDAATGSNLNSSSTWKYFNSPEDGARMTKGWFKVVAPDEDTAFGKTFDDYTFAKTNADDESEKWYYADGDGKLASSEIKKIKGKYYGFRKEDGKKGAAMLTGLCLMKVDSTTGEILEIAEEDMDADYLDDIIDGDHDDLLDDGYSLYYFGNDADTDGAMKTGNTTISLDGESYTFKFSTSGGVEGKGKGLTGIEDKKYVYKAGVRLKADSEDKYIVVKATGDTGASNVTVEKIKSEALREKAKSAGTNKDNETVKYVNAELSDKLDADCYLVNTSGTIVKNKTAAKDGADWYFYVEDKEVKMYTNNKTLTGTSIADWK